VYTCVAVTLITPAGQVIAQFHVRRPLLEIGEVPVEIKIGPGKPDAVARRNERKQMPLVGGPLCRTAMTMNAVEREFAGQGPERSPNGEPTEQLDILTAIETRIVPARCQSRLPAEHDGGADNEDHPAR
jgi:hypothetical protein